MMVQGHKKSKERMDNLENMVKSLSTTVIEVKSVMTELLTKVPANAVRINRVDRRVTELITEIDSSRATVNSKMKCLEEQLKKVTMHKEDDITRLISANIQSLTGLSDQFPNEKLSEIQRELTTLKKDQSVDQNVVESLRELVADIQQKINSTGNMQGTSNNGHVNQNSYINLEKQRRERDIMKSSIMRSSGIIRQLIATKISSEFDDISLIKKCKTVDIPLVSKTVAACELSLFKYVGFPGMDQEFYADIGDLLGEATTWCMEVEEVYSRMEVHSINTTMGDVKDVGVFSDNFEKTVYEFIDKVENAYLTAGTSRQ